jgi:serine/threonine-protein kinase
MIGTTVGQYRITGELGRGGMGCVYAATHALIGRPAAVKVLLPELSQNQEMVTRFFNEARAATTIRHPGIVEVYDFGFHVDGSAYIVMELLGGESLAARLSRGRMASHGALGLIRQVAGALAAAHAKGIVHRDLKPDNVFLVPDPDVPGGERIKLLDFGIAKLAGESGLTHKTRTGAVMGTPTYMAPEQCRGVAVDHRADLYSLGCILFELCTGRPPFVGEGVGDVLAAHIHVPPPSVRSMAPDVPHEFEVLVQRMLVKDPTQRLQSAEALIHAIGLASGTPAYHTGPPVSGGATVPTSPGIPGTPGTLSGSAWSTPTGGDLPPPQRGRGLVVGAIAAVAIAGIVIAIVATSGGKAGPAAGATAGTTVVDAGAVAVTPPPAADAAPAIDAAPAELATIEVAIDSKPSGAQVVLGGDVLGTTPYRGTLPRGAADVTLVVRLAGHKDAAFVTKTDAAIARVVKLTKKRGRPAGSGDDRDDGANPF